MVTEIQRKSELAMLKVQQRALEKGLVCSKPLVDGARYDLIVDDRGKLHRAQVKYCSRQAGDAIAVSLRCSPGQGAGRAYTSEEVDVLLVYTPVTDAVYAVPAKHFCGKWSVALRLKKAKNNQTKGVLHADSFLW